MTDAHDQCRFSTEQPVQFYSGNSVPIPDENNFRLFALCRLTDAGKMVKIYTKYGMGLRKHEWINCVM